MRIASAISTRAHRGQSWPAAGLISTAIILFASALPLYSAQPTTMPTTNPASPTRPGQRIERLGDEIMVCGQLFHTGGAPVVLWTDPGGYDAYRVERRFAPFEQSSWEATLAAHTGIKWPNRYNIRESVLSPAELETIRGGGWDLALLQQKVDQFVIHYDACGTSRQCFMVLHDDRGLSVHFLLDLDGTIYQTLDLKERAWHATIANSRAIGIEIANLGAYGNDQNDPFKQWYTKDANGRLRITIPSKLGDGGIRTPNFIARPVRNRLIRGTIQGYPRRQYDFTPQQYESLAKLTATLCTIFPKLKCDYPKEADGSLVRQKLPDDKLAAYQGVLGHYHVQSDKIDPGPAFQWDRVVNGARQLMSPAPAPVPPPTTEPSTPAPTTAPSEPVPDTQPTTQPGAGEEPPAPQLPAFQYEKSN